MRRPRPWHVESNEPLGSYRVFSVTALHARRDGDGKEHTFYRIDAADWVNVVALTADDEVIMIHQYRLGAACQTLEIPGGVVDPGESVLGTAERELLEETGYAAEAWTQIGAINPNPALYGNTLYTFLAQRCHKVAEIANDEAEETIVELVPRSELDARVKQGAVGHALVLTAFHWWALHEAAR